MAPKKKDVETPPAEAVTRPADPPRIAEDAGLSIYTDRSGSPRLNGLTEGLAGIGAVTAHAQSLKE